LDWSALVALHADMPRDFPPAEIKPLALLRRQFNAGLCTAAALCDENGRAAYALFQKPREGNVWLLDYLAVDATRRGQGVGSDFLRHMQALPADALMIEIERVDRAQTPAQHTERARRRAFYLQNGAVPTGVFTRADGGVEFEILCLPLKHRVTGTTAADAMRRLYETLFTPDMYAIEL
jgi:GNAT superfamily N-acetyltransferase